MDGLERSGVDLVGWRLLWLDLLAPSFNIEREVWKVDAFLPVGGFVVQLSLLAKELPAFEVRRGKDVRSVMGEDVKLLLLLQGLTFFAITFVLSWTSAIAGGVSGELGSDTGSLVITVLLLLLDNGDSSLNFFSDESFFSLLELRLTWLVVMLRPLHP